MNIPLPVWLSPTALLMALATGVGGYTAGRVQQYYDDREDYRVAALEASAKARETETELRNTHKETEDDLKQKLAEAADRERDLSDELRKRPSRLPPAARAACAGSTGAELSNGDGQFLTWYAARARATQLELEACYAREEANYNALTRAK